MTEQELKKLRDIIYAVHEDGRMRRVETNTCHIACQSILTLIKEAGYVKLANSQGAPKDEHWQGYHQRSAYSNAQQEMIQAGWRKVEIWKSP